MYALEKGKKVAGGPIDFYRKRRKWKRFQKEHGGGGTSAWDRRASNQVQQNQGLDLIDWLIIGSAAEHYRDRNK